MIKSNKHFYTLPAVVMLSIVNLTFEARIILVLSNKEAFYFYKPCTRLVLGVGIIGNYSTMKTRAFIKVSL